jgi:nicotinate-nucleotide pyrophosphorylase (carboxylating)
MELSAAEIRRAVQAALAEDIGSGDATTLATVPATATACAVLRAREPLVVAGLDFAEAAFRGAFEFINRRGELGEPPKSQNESGRRITPPSEGEIKIERLAKDGQRVNGNEILLKISGTARAVLRAREPLVVAGLDFAEAAFRELSSAVRVKRLVRDGRHVKAGANLLTISGPARAVLSAERVALNFVQRLSGIATLTAQFVDAIKDTPAQILDTRKTTPGWRRFEKYAVACGGGKNHRLGLDDMVLIKDNHLATLRDAMPNAIAAAVRRAHAKFPQLKIEVEADTLAQAGQAADAGADIILLDNMSPARLRLAVQKVKGRAKTEASGGVTLKTVRAIAKTGVDFISVGALTHSAHAVDMGLDFEG